MVKCAHEIKIVAGQPYNLQCFINPFGVPTQNISLLSELLDYQSEITLSSDSTSILNIMLTASETIPSTVRVESYDTVHILIQAF